MSDRKGSTCGGCGKKYHCCSGCDTGGEDYLWYFCSHDCAHKAKQEWAQQEAAKYGLTPEQMLEIASDVNAADWRGA